MKALAPAFTVLFIQIPFFDCAGILPIAMAPPSVIGLLKVTPPGADVPVGVSVTLIEESEPIAAGSSPMSISSSGEAVSWAIHILAFVYVSVAWLLKMYINLKWVAPALLWGPVTFGNKLFRVLSTIRPPPAVDMAPPRELRGSVLAAPPLKRKTISDATIGILNYLRKGILSILDGNNRITILETR